MTPSYGKFFAGLLLIVFSATGCVAEAIPPSASPNEPSESSVPVDLAKEFRSIADASCQMAYEIGVTEVVVGAPNRLVLFPESYSYNDFSAAVVSDDGDGAPIWSTEDFVVCVDSINYSMAEEGGSQYELIISGDLDAGKLRSEYSVEGYGLVVTDYTVRDGVIIEVKSSFEDSQTVTEVQYGLPSEQDMEHFRNAIDAFLSSE